jgi:hypothetical protein
MQNLKVYESFSGSNEQEEESRDLLIQAIEDLKQEILKRFFGASMEADFVEISDPQEFVIEYFPGGYDGRVPKRISYFLDDLAKFLSVELGTNVNWNFSPNGNVQRVEFTLDRELDPRFIKVKQSAKLS